MLAAALAVGGVPAIASASPAPSSTQALARPPAGARAVASPAVTPAVGPAADSAAIRHAARPSPVPAPAPAAPTVGTAPPHRPAHGDAVLTRQSGTVPAVRAGTVRGTTKVLVVLAYWGTHHDSVTRAHARAVFAADNRWYRAASFGRYGVSATVTPWLRIPAQSCGYDEYQTVFGAARKAAARRGYDAARYGRLVVYTPCTTGSMTGLGAQPGTQVLLFSRGMDLSTTVHEQGHNLGLDHANELSCGTAITYRAQRSCGLNEYADFTSAMGADVGRDAYAGDFTAPQKATLGWLSGHLRTVRGSGTATLAPYETGTGTKALEVPGSAGRTYWVEYRTARGNDARQPAYDHGVMLHVSLPGGGTSDRSLLLPMLPGVPAGTTTPYPQVDTWALPPGSSWTSPEGIRFTVRAESSGGARVTVSRHAAAHVPGRPSAVRVTALDNALTVSFRRAPDNGRLVRSYTVTAKPANRTWTIRDYSSRSGLTLTLPGLHDGTRYLVTVAAKNELGTGPPSAGLRVSPRKLYPRVRIVSPRGGTSVHGLVQVKATAAANSLSRVPVHHLSLYVDTVLADDYYGHAGTTLTWDTGAGGTWRLGRHVLTVVAVDDNRRATRSAAVTVQLTSVAAPAIHIATPSKAGTVHGLVAISGTVTRFADKKVTSLEVDVDGDAIDTVFHPTAGTWHATWDTSYWTSGTHTVTVTAMDTAGREGSVSRKVRLAVVGPVISALTPTSGSFHVSVPFRFTVQDNSAAADVNVDVSIDGTLQDSTSCAVAADASASCRVDVDITGTADGNHTFTLTPTDSVGTGGASVSVTLTVAQSPFLSSVSPASGTVRATVPFTFTARTRSASPDLSVEIDVDGSYLASGYCAVPTTALASCTVDADLSSVADGSHTFSLTPTDADGRTGSAATVTLMVRQAPSITGLAPSSGSVTGTVHFTFTATDRSGSDDVPVEVDVDGSYWDSTSCSVAAGQAAGCSYDLDTSSLTPGPQTFTFIPSYTLGTGTSASATLTVE